MTPAVFVISSGRPGNVPTMQRWCAGLHPTWLVRSADVASYKRAGAARVQAIPGGLSQQRNAALGLAFQAGRDCAQLDDDLRKLQLAGPPVREVGLAQVLAIMGGRLDETGALLAGVAPTANPYFSRRPLTTWGFVPSMLTLTRNNPLRYDPHLRLKEDWDLTCQHLQRYGLVARCDEVLATFAFASNAGGCQRYRTPDLEEATCSHLLARWPSMLRPHSRRANELALRQHTERASA